MDAVQMSSKNWINIIILGFGFMLLFSAFQTSAFVQAITIRSFLSPKCSNISHGDIVDGGIHISEGFANRIGYISLCIIYLMVAIANWLSVSVVAVAGAKLSLIVSGALYVVYIAALIRPYVPVIFIGAFILGTGGGVLWTAQGQILIQNSSKKRMPTTSGIFWFMLQLSLVFGNLFFFLLLFFREKSHGEESEPCIPHEDNYIIFAVLACMGMVGVASMVFITSVQRKPATSDVVQRGLNSSEEKALLSEGTQDWSLSWSRGNLPVFAQAIVNAVRLLFTREMFLLSLTFIYTGYELNFWSGVYGALIGHTRSFHYYSIGLAGLFVGLGEILGGGLFGILGSYTNRYGRDPVVLLGMLIHLTTFLLVFYNLPSKAISEDVPAALSFGYLFDPSNIYLGILCAFLLGFGDSLFNTQIYSLIGVLYPTDDRSAPAMALFKFFQSLAAMVGFLTSAFIHLQWQLLILAVLAVVGTLSFSAVEWKHYKRSDPLPPKMEIEREVVTSEAFKY